MVFAKFAVFLLFLAIVEEHYCSTVESKCTKVKTIDGSVGVDCERTPQSSDKFEPTEDHFVDDETPRAKRDTKEEPETADFQISNLFIQNLELMAQANMSDCMDRVNCEEKCQLIVDKVFKVSDDNKQLEGLDTMPTFVRSFYEAGKKGIRFGGLRAGGQCGDCKKTYKNCNAMQYDYTIKTNALYKELTEKNVTLFDANEAEKDIPQELQYLHHSMRFLDLANLSLCYARVSCEATCFQAKSNPRMEAPPAKSPLLENDPHKPKSVDIIHEGALLGYALAFNGQCSTCAARFAKCPSDRYSIAHTSSQIFG